MALSVKRFAVWSIAGCVATVCLARIFADGVTGRSLDAMATYRLTEVTRANRVVNEMRVAVHALQLQDSVRRALQSRPAPAGVSVVLPNRASPRARHAIDSTLRATWSAIVGDREWGSTLFLAVEDTGQMNGRVVTSYSLPMILPWDLDGKTCVILLGTNGLGDLTGANRASRDSVLSRAMRQATGPCAFVARYGPPGAGTRAWLTAESWTPAWVPPLPGHVVPPATPLALPEMRLLAYGSFIPWYEEFGRSAAIDHESLGCLSRGADPCRRLLHRASPRGPDRRHVALPAGFVEVTIAWGGELRFGFLAALERELGAERFAQFWKSDKAPELALADLGGAAEPVIRQALGRGVKPHIASSWPTAVEWLVYLAFLAVPVGLMLARSNRRFLPT